MRQRDGLEHHAHERDAFGDVHAPVVAVAVDALALHELEHQVGLAAVGHAGVEQVGDVRVRQPRQHLAFALEAQRAGAADQRRVQQLHRDGALEAAVGAAREPDAAGAALADGRLQRVGADALAGERAGRVVRCRGRGAGKELRVLGALGVGEQRREFAGERGVVDAQGVEAGGPLRGVEVEQVVEQRTEPLPALGVRNDHGVPPSAR